MKNIQSIAVYCASSNKLRPSFVEAAERLGNLIAAEGMRLVYGDGGIGLMAAVARGMVALPGGIGTFEELLECLTWKQLGLHHNPVVILNTDGYYDRLLACLDLMVEEQMMRPIHKEMFVVVNQPEEVIPAILNAKEWDPNTRRLAAI